MKRCCSTSQPAWSICGSAGSSGFCCRFRRRRPVHVLRRTSRPDDQEHFAAAPSGQPVPLQEAVLPVPDGLVLFVPHPGQGRLLLNMIDPSVTDETDQLSCDPELDPYSPANGFAPEGSSSSPHS